MVDISKLLPWKKQAQDGSTSSLLVFCRSVDDLSHSSLKKTDHTVVAAAWTEPVVAAADKKPWIDQAHHVDVENSIFDLFDDMNRIREDVEEWLQSIGESVDCRKDVLFWEPSPEGGKTTQRILDAIHIIQSVQQLIDKFSPDRVFVAISREYEWEDRVVIDTVQAAGIDCRNLCSVSDRLLQELGLWSGPKISIFGHDIRLPSAVESPSRLVRYQFSLFLKFVRIKMRYWRDVLNGNTKIAGVSDAETDDRVALFQLLGPADKHIDARLPLMRTLGKYGEFYPVVTGLPETVDKIREEGFEATEMERVLPLSSVVSVAQTTWRFHKKMNTERAEFLDREPLTYRNVPIGKRIWPAVEWFVQAELPHQLFYKNAADKYLSLADPAVSKSMNGGLSVKEGMMFQNSLIEHTDTLSFHYEMTPKHYRWPIFYDKNDIYFTQGELEKSRLILEGVDPDRIFSVGSHRYQYIESFRNRHNSASSRERLGLPDSQYLIFFDPGIVLQAYGRTSHNKWVLTETLFEFAAEYSSVCVLVKQHPKAESSIIKRLYEKFDTGNIVTIPADESIYHCLNASDIVITRESTIGLEALLFEKPLISVTFDSTIWQGRYGGVSESFYDAESLITFLEQIATDQTQYDEWIRLQDRLRNDFFRSGYQRRSDREQLICDILIDHLD